MAREPPLSLKSFRFGAERVMSRPLPRLRLRLVHRLLRPHRDHLLVCSKEKLECVTLQRRPVRLWGFSNASAGCAAKRLGFPCFRRQRLADWSMCGNLARLGLPFWTSPSFFPWFPTSPFLKPPKLAVSTHTTRKSHLFQGKPSEPLFSLHVPICKQKDKFCRASLT